MVEAKKTTAKKNETKHHSKPHQSKTEHDSSNKHHVKTEDSKAHTKKTTPHTSEHHKQSHEKTPSKEAEKEYNPKILFSLIAVGVIIIAAVFLIFAYPDFLGPQGEKGQKNNNNNALPTDDTSTLPEESSSNEVVVTVNGEEITAQEVSQVQQQLSSQGQQQVNQDQAVQQIITNTLLLQQTQGDVESISDKDAEAELEKVLGAQGFTTQDLKNDLEQQGLSYKETLQDFKQRIAINRYLEENVDTSSVTVSDEQVQQTYTQYEQQLGNQTPPFKQVEQDIRNQLEQEQVQQLQSQFIEQLVDEANIEHN